MENEEQKKWPFFVAENHVSECGQWRIASSKANRKATAVQNQQQRCAENLFLFGLFTFGGF